MASTHSALGTVATLARILSQFIDRVLQCVAVCCRVDSILCVSRLGVAVCCSVRRVLLAVARLRTGCCSVLQYGLHIVCLSSRCCSVLQYG